MTLRAVSIFLISFVLQIEAWALTLTEGSVWNRMPIPVCFEDPRPEHQQDRQQIRKSVERSWAKESAITFSGWRRCQEDSDGIRIRLSDETPKTLMRGRQLDGVTGGMELSKLWGLAALSVNAKSTVHEFGHALGFGHEYARADAPYEDDCAVTQKNGERYIEHDLPITTFDFDSIMVACVKNATRSFSIGVPRLSAADIYGLIKTYGSAPDNILDEDEAGDLFGHSLAVGDFDGDDIPDLAVGAPGETPPGSRRAAGAVYLYKGDLIRGLRPWGRLTQAGSEAFGASLAAERLDKDRRADLIVGSASSAPTIFRGRSRKIPLLWKDARPAPALTPIASEVGPMLSVEPFDTDGSSEAMGFGHVRIFADLDVDGHDDLIVSAPNAPVNGQPSGRVFVYRSPNVNRPWKERPRGFVSWYRFGQSY